MKLRGSQKWAVKQQVWKAQREEGVALPSVSSLADAKRAARTQKAAMGKPTRGRDMDLMGSSRRELRAARPKTTFELSPGALVRVAREHTYVVKNVSEGGVSRPAYFKAAVGALGTVVGDPTTGVNTGYISVAFADLGIVDVHPRSLRDVGEADDEE